MAKKSEVIELPSEPIPEETTTKKMTKKDAEAIIAKYAGINSSPNEPEELTQAKALLRG